MNAHFPPILLDDGRPGNMCSPDIPLLGRIWNVFCAEDLNSFAFRQPSQPPILRLYDLSLLEKLTATGLETSPVILSHLIDSGDKQLPDRPAGLALEVANRAGLVRANKLHCNLIIGRSFEIPGPGRECSAFLLFQLLSSESRHPFYLHGNTGYELFQAYLAQGASGIVLPENQFKPDKSSEIFRFPLDGGANLRLHVKGGAPEAVGLRKKLLANGHRFLAESFSDGLWITRHDDLLSPDNRPHLAEYLQLFELSPHNHVPAPCFYQGSPAARQLRCPLPIVQGPMANVTVTSAFAQAVFKAGAFPNLALAGLPLEQACALLREMAQLGIPFGAGIVSVSADDAHLEMIISCLEETRPTLVILAAPQLDHVQRLLQTNLNLAVHAPNGAMFGVLFDMGVRTFIIEGEEAGGHVSRIGSLGAWQEVLYEIRNRGVQQEVHLILAGGILGSASSELIAHLLNFFGMAGELKVSLQMGTAYLGTREALELTPMPAIYQKLLFNLDETIVTGETLHRNVRQLATPATTDLLEQEWSIFTSDLDLGEKKHAYERLYQGAHRRAITSAEHDPTASYLAGAIATRIEKSVTLRELHRALVPEKRPMASTAATEPGPIAIVGAGIQIPGADSLEQHFRNLLLKRCFIRDIPDDRLKRSDFLTTDPNDRSRSYSGLAGMIEKPDDDLSMFRIPPRVANEMKSFQVIALQCAYRALKDAGFFLRPVPRNKVATFVGVNGNTSQPPTNSMILWKMMRERLLMLPEIDAGKAKELDELFEHYELLYHDDWIYTEDTRTGQLASIVASRIANVFDLGGMTNTLDAACASGLAAVAQAMTMLNQGRCDVALAGAVGPALSPDAFVSFSSLHALSAQGSFPFDARADGFVLGEGGGMFVLKRERDALLHGDRIYAVIHGWGASSDGAGKGITAPNHKGQRRALEDAYSSSGIDPLQLDFLECHATGTPVGDREERISVHGFFGEARHKQGKPPLPIGGSKAVTGHLLSGAGVVSMLSGLFAINLHRVPPQVNFEQAPDDVDLESLGLKVAARPEVIQSRSVLAGVSAFGFGGVNYHLVLSSPEHNARAPLLDAAEADFPLFDDLSGDTLFMFPGQGSQYPGMLHAFRDDAGTRKLLAHAASLFKDYSDAPLEQMLLVDPSLDEAVLQSLHDQLKDTAISQPAIFLTSVILLEKLREKNIRPAMAIGHSLGEYSAIHAAGMLGFDDAFRMVCIRGQLMSAKAGDDPGAMVALACGGQKSGEMLDGIAGYAVCSNFNAYEQTVASGETAAIRQLMERAETQGIRAHLLPVSRGFHSSLVADCVAPMVQALSGCGWRNAAIPILANLSRQAYPLTDASLASQSMSEQDRAFILSLLGRHIAAPVDFISQINAAYESGIRRFVEVGPKNILTRLVDQILQGKPFQTEAIQHASESMPDRISGLAERLRQPLVIKRQPLPVQRTVSKAEPMQSAASPARLDPEQLVRAAVAEVSGYAPEQIRDDAEFERDLGIDTLKIFEILSRLRGSILPQQVGNFRQLTSVDKILAAANTARANAAMAAPHKHASDDRHIHCYYYRTSRVGRLASVPAESGGPQGKLIIERLPSTIPAIASELLPRLHRQLREHGNAPAGNRPSAINLVTYAPADEFYDGAHLALTAFFRCAQKDIPDTVFTYTHFDGTQPSGDSIAAALKEPRIGRRILNDGCIVEGRLCPIEQLFGERDRLAELLTGKDVVLVTGGARGITAEVTKSLIRETRARFILLGRQARIESWTEELGPQRVRYVAADLLDEAAIDALGLGSLGITLVIHGAGIEVSQNLVSKNDEEFSQVLGIKVGGLERILSRLDPATLRGVVQFSSVVSYVGNNGQADYGAANGILNGTLPSGTPALSIAWSAWDEVGMATRGVVKQIFETRGVRMIPLEAGIEVFERMLAGFLASPPKGTTRTAVFGATTGYQSTDEVLLPSPAPIPLSQYRLSDPEGLLELEMTVDLERHGFLKDHSFGGNVVTPACIMLRQFVVAALAGNVPTDDRLIRFEDTEFLLPLVLLHGEKIRLRLSRQGDEYIIDRQDGSRSLPVMRTRMQLPDADNETIIEAAATTDFLENSAGVRSTPFDIDPTPIVAEYGLCNFGPAFEVLNNVAFNGVVLRAEVNLEKADAAGATLLTDTGRVAYLLEAAFFSCSRWKFFNVTDNLLQLPSSISSCTIFTRRCANAKSATVYAKCHDEGKTLRFDCAVVDEENRPLLVLYDYRFATPGNISRMVHRPLTRSVPLRLGAATLLLLDLPQAVAWAEKNMSLTPQETNEIATLNSSKRRHERLAGKLAAKLLACDGAHDTEALAADGLALYQVLSDNAPVKLTLDGKPLSEQPFFSISHTDDLVCAARADRPVGIDVERVRSLPEKTIQDICSAALLQKMHDYLDQDLLPDDRNALAAALPILVFTQKEAVLKASGIGLVEGLDNVHLEEFAVNRETRASHRGLLYRVISTFNNEHVISAAVAEQLQESVKEPEAPVIPVPLSFLQEPLCRSEQQRIDGLSYALTHRIRLRGALDAQALKQALQVMHRKHDVLRMGFDSNCAGFVRQSGFVLLRELRLDDLAAEEADQQAQSLLQEFAGRNYDLSKDVLYRILLLRLPGEANLLLVNFHHLIMDCFSSFDYSNELMKVYHLICQGREPDGHYPQYAAFAARLRERLTPDRLRALRQYWADQLANTVPVELPSRPQAAQGVAHAEFRIGDQEHLLIEGYCRHTGVTLFIGLLTAMQAALLGWLKRSEIFIGIPFSLRDRATESGMLGPFVNLLPIRAAVAELTTWSALSHELRGALFDGIDHSDIPLSVPATLCMRDTKGGYQQAAVICQLIHEPEASGRRQELEVYRSVVDGHHDQQALVISFFLDTGRLRCAVTRNTAFLDQDTLDSLILDFRRLIARMCAAPDAQVWQREGAAANDYEEA